MWFIISYSQINLHLVFFVSLQRLLPSSYSSARERQPQLDSVVRGKTPDPVGRHHVQLDPGLSPLVGSHEACFDHQVLNKVMSFQLTLSVLTVDIEGFHEHLFGDPGLLDEALDGGRRILSHMHESEETSVLELNVIDLAEIDDVVSPRPITNDSKRDQDTLKLPETFREVRDLVDPLNLSRVHLVVRNAEIPHPL